MKIRMASEFTNPVITERGMNRISLATPASPSTTCRMPARMTVAKRYCTPWEATTGAITRAVAAVAAEIMAGRPPRNAIEMAMTEAA